MIIIFRKEKAKTNEQQQQKSGSIPSSSSPPFCDGTFKVKEQVQTQSQIGPHKTL